MNKHKLIQLFAAAVLTVASLTSCEGYLDTLPSGSLISEDAITTLQDVETALNGAYYDLKNSSYYGNDFIARAEVGGEDIQTISQGGKRTDGFYRFVHRQNNSPSAFWTIPYRIINRTNVLLRAIDSGSISASKELNNAKGEALAMRALCHFNLLITYGKPYFVENGNTPGVVLAKSIISSEELPARSTVAEGYAMVIEDLENSVELIDSEIKNGRFNVWAVKSLLARVNLYKGDWNKAFTYAAEVIEKSPYKLVTHEEYLAAWKGRYTSESILDIEISDLDAGNREMLGYVVDPKGYAAVSTTKAFENLLTETTEDIRNGLLANASEEGRFYINKYPGIDGKPAVNNVRVIRLSDIYLIAAESALKKTLKDQTAADRYLNTIIKRAIPSATDVNATVERVLTERRKELVMEGHRLYDILRLGIEVKREGGYHFLNSVDLVSPSYKDFRTILAIPQAEIDVNPNIKQNEGYQ